MAIKLTQKIVQQFQHHAEIDYPHECCGIILGRWNNNGAEALEKLEESDRSNTSPDLLLSDIKMPDLNGYELFRESQDRFPGIPVILMTGFGYDPNHSIVRASQEGMQTVLFKPFKTSQLVDAVTQAVACS